MSRTESRRDHLGMHPNAISEVRRRRPSLSDLPDEAVAKLSVTQWTSLALYVDDLVQVPLRDASRLWARMRRVMRR